MGDFNLALVIVAVVVCVIVFLVNVYLLVNYQHPDDANQAYFPKFVVVLGLSVAAISILMLPADVANRQACRHAIYNGACSLTLPMKDLWLAVYILDAVLVFFVIPFAMFFYEGDQDKYEECGKEDQECFVVDGHHGYSVRPRSGGNIFAVAHTPFFPTLSSNQCSAFSASPSSEKTWTMRTTFPEYVVALATIVGSVLFAIFGGVGIACLPLGLIFSFIRRPKAVITRSQYIKEATELGKKARELKKAAEALHQEERSGSKGRKFRKNVKEVEKELFQLEEDVKLLEEVYPQGEKVSLLGTAAFAFFCFYLLLAVIAGAMMLGLRLVFITIHPMNVIQFCSTAFAYYAQATAAQEIFGHTLESLRGIKYLYKDGEEKSLVAGSNCLHEVWLGLEKHFLNLSMSALRLSTTVLNHSSTGVLMQLRMVMLKEHDHAHMVKVNSSLRLSISVLLIKHGRA
ncbi:hypothetical protein JHK86_050934 [Glycine max]|nr:hypothetical protein JHK86_050934 [Glycine max]